ncbi:MAG: hypothetical protein ABI232_04230 [Jatrophihabitantaceae bacterium]
MSESGTQTITVGEPPTDVPGVENNSRLTSMTGMVLLVMLAVEGYTILDVQGMITLHIFLGTMLVGPVVWKCATTIYRFFGYYSGKPTYVKKGPPHIVLRVLGPIVIISSLAVLGTGIGLLATHSRDGGFLLTAHQASFIVWVSAMTIHVLGHIQAAAAKSWQELRHRSAGRGRRLVAIVLAITIGVAVAGALLPHATQWTQRPPGHFGQLGHFKR